MVEINQYSKKETPSKRQDALEKSCYSIIRDRKESKASLEKSKVELLVNK